jgi:hypothetical protein
MRSTTPLVALLAMLGCIGGARAQVRVQVGPTPIPNSDARAAGDITVVNEKLAFALAVQSPAPYGVPRGALVAIAPVTRGMIGRNRVVFADFIPNNWSAWPNTYQHVEIVERGPDEVRIRTVRDFGKVKITTLYTLAAGADELAISATMTNEGDAALPGLLSGLTLWPNSGFLFPVPGLAGVTEGSAQAALASRVVAYDADWSVTLHAPYLDHVGSGSRDLFALHTLAAKASRTFSGWLQVGPSGDLAPVVAADIERGHLASGTVRGTVTDRAGKAIAQPVVVVEKNGKPYAWTLGQNGNYRFALPTGDYLQYASARNYARSEAVPLKIVAGDTAQRSFHDLRSPGAVEFSVVDARNGRPLDARIVITEGEKPLVEFLGRKTFFTELERKGSAQLPIAPGQYLFTISSGGGFLARDALVPVSVQSGSDAKSRIAITPLFDPPTRGWYSADLHHHADQAEAVTPPAELARSQLAAGLNLLFVSDHDSTVNDPILQRIADARGVPFIASMEFSPSWGHFNAYPLAPGSKLLVDTSTASVEMIFKEARREGATVVQVNHPFIPYGYFASLEAGVAPGGFNAGFDVVEINATVPGDDHKVLQKLWSFWNANQHYYLAAGTDTHDVWSDESGRVRTFVHLQGAVSAQAFAASLKEGHAYVTRGPLIFPVTMFGTQLQLQAGAPFNLDFDLASVAGLRKAELISGGTLRDTRKFAGAPLQAHVSFALRAEQPGWYQLIVEDEGGRPAYTDPVWLAVAGSAPPH